MCVLEGGKKKSFWQEKVHRFTEQVKRPKGKIYKL